MNISGFFRYIVSLSLLGSVLAIGLFLIKLFFRQKLSANWHYYIWFVLILRLLLPFTPTSPFSALNLLPQYPQTIQLSPAITQPSVDLTLIPSDPNINIIAPASSDFSRGAPVHSSLAGNFELNWATAALVWLIGVLVILVYLLVVNGLVLRKSHKQRGCDDENVARIVEECRLSLRLGAKISVIYDDLLKSPALLGLFQPKIIISPELITHLSPEELRYIFLHELSHLKRRDLLFNSFVTLVQVIYWFNPLIWYALHQMKEDCEIACDATALATVKPEEHKRYAQTIISILQLLSESQWAPGTIGFASKFNSRRIVMISTFRKTNVKWTIAALTLTLVVGCSSLSTPINPASNGQNQEGTPISSQLNGANENTSTSSSSADLNSIVYRNSQYGFSFLLPESWKGYSIVTDKWGGSNLKSGEIAATGPMISIRHPQWTPENQRQDIPIMIFSVDQWNSLEQEEFHIGPAPIGPSELGRNNIYVFALPARYNYAFLPGYKEVEQILKKSPLHATQTTDPTTAMLLIMMQLAQQGKIFDFDFPTKFPAKTSRIEDVEKYWGKPEQTDYVAAAKGIYATYLNHNIVFGFNKGGQIFEVRSLASNQFVGITLAKIKEVLGTPTYDTTYSGQEIIGYPAGPEFKLEIVFPQPTTNNPNPPMDHYNVLYPQGTINLMADDPGRQW